MKEKFLVTLATGRTGYAVTVDLLKQGCSVRIYVRNKNKKAAELERLGAEVAIGDFDDPIRLNIALEDVSKVYYCYPIKKGMPESIRIFIDAASKQNIDGVVFMGQWLAEFNDQESLLTNDIRKAYKLLEKSGLRVVYFNPGFFADNNIALTESIVQLGIMPSPYGEGKCPWISTGDMARVVVELLKDPTSYYGKKVHPTGPESISAQEMADIYSKITGRKVRLMPVSDKMFMKAVLAAAEEFGFDEFMAVQTVLYMREFRKNKFIIGGSTSVVKDLTGKEPEDFETIARGFINNSPCKERSFKNWLRAVKNLFKLMFTAVPGKAEIEKLNSY